MCLLSKFWTIRIKYISNKDLILNRLLWLKSLNWSKWQTHTFPVSDLLHQVRGPKKIYILKKSVNIIKAFYIFIAQADWFRLSADLKKTKTNKTCGMPSLKKDIKKEEVSKDGESSTDGGKRLDGWREWSGGKTRGQMDGGRITRGQWENTEGGQRD